MLNLIKLEMRRFGIAAYVKSIIIINFLMSAIVLALYYAVPLTGEPNPLASYQDALFIIDRLVRVVFILYAAVLISRLIIGEYKNKTISLLFTYPINRKKIILSKLLIVCTLTFAMILISNVFVTFIFWVADSIVSYIPGSLAMEDLGQQAIKIVVQAVAASGMSLIPLYFGMLKKSVPTTILSSFIVLLITTTSIFRETLGSIILTSALLAAAGPLVSYLSIRNVEYTDAS
ncbi:ABC transporter permease [Paenibacillus phytorum]|nr:ABC transporter permease [Paenibacillus phytorum]